MRVRMRLRLWKSVSKGERKCIIKNPTKIEKIKEPSQCRLVWWWLVLWMACECRLKKKTKMEKTNYKIMARITLAWGKHKNGKNQLQKTGQTREKLENKKNRCRCVRECRFGGSFFILLESKERVAVAVAVVGPEYWCIIPVLSPCSFHPPCWRLDEGWIFLPSSILHRWNLPNSWGVPVSVGIHILFVTRGRICLVFRWMWDLDLGVKWNRAKCIRWCHY